MSLGCVDGTKGCKNPKDFSLARGKIGRVEWEEVGGRRGNKRTDGLGRRVSLIVSVPFLGSLLAFSRLTCQKEGLKDNFVLVLGPAFVWWCVVVGWWWWWCTVRAVGGINGGS